MLADGLSYEETLALHYRRLRVEAAFTEAFGPRWRRQVPPTLLVEHDLGQLDPIDPVQLMALAQRRRQDLARARAYQDDDDADAFADPGAPDGI